jgi:outer membrane receptor protein involved in Fe transport
MNINRIGRHIGARALVSVTILCLLTWLTPTSLAQTTTATISGVVTDHNGAIVAGARIIATNVGTNVSRSVNTDSDGRYLILALPVGNYEVQAIQQGFSKELRRGILLTVGRDAIVNFELKVGSVTEQVEIAGDASLVNTTSSEISALVNARTIVDLPLNGRDLFQLATLQIGVINIGNLTENALDSGTGSVKMSINGARPNFNNFLLDGASVSEVQNTTPGSVTGGFTGVDAIQEFQLLTNNYSAEYGGAGGGIINVVTKSGTNEVHGTAFEFLRNSALDARNFFDLEDVPQFKRNQFGGSIGAPIRRNKTFIFGAYEGFRQRLAQTRIFTVPTAEARRGILPTGNITINPAVEPYLDLYPLPNAGDAGGGLGFYTRGDSGQTNEDYFTIRADHNFSSKDTFFARYTFDDSELNEPDKIISNTVLEGRTQYTGLGHTHIFSPTLLNNLRFAYNRTRIFGDQVDVVPVPESLVWVPGAPVLGAFINVGGLSELSDRRLVPRFLVQNSFEVTEQLAYSRGSHNMKFGFTARRIQLNAVSTNIPFGAFIFGSYEAFLRGTPQIFAAPLADANNAYRGIRQSLFALYAQDEWRVRRNLTINLGLRYEPITTPSEANDKISNLRDPLNDREVTLGAPFFKNNSKKNFGPRVGFAWDLSGDGKTSLRGGYGIFFVQPLPYSYRFEMSGQPPFFIVGFAFGGPFPNAFERLANVPGLVASAAYEFDPSPAYLQQYNLSLQREIIGGFTATIAYVGSRGVHLPTNGNRNTSANFTILPNGEKQFPVGVRNPLRNPFQAATRVTYFDGDSYYNALQLNVERRLSQGLQLQMAYTFSKSIDTSSDSVGIFQLESTQFGQDTHNLRAERGLSVFDVRHNFSMNVIYQLPYKTEPGASGARRVADFLLGGWQANSIITARSGTPFNPIITFNNSNDGNADNIERPSWAPGFTPESAVTGNPNRYFRPEAFVVAPPGRFGNVARNVLIGPGLATVDLSLMKSNKIKERVTVQFRAEAFNLLNRANFSLPATVEVFTSNGVTPPNVGQIISTTTTSRQLQFGLKFIF